MKAIYLIVGLLLGGALGFVLAGYLGVRVGRAATATVKQADSATAASKWKWPDSLDAVKAAPQSHKIVYEDSTVRILQVVLEPNKTEPIHVHKWKSVMWFTQATPMIYYRNELESGSFAVKDSISIPQMPPEVLNHGDVLPPEEPHAIRNLGNKIGVAYRVEFKK